MEAILLYKLDSNMFLKSTSTEQ